MLKHINFLVQFQNMWVVLKKLQSKIGLEMMKPISMVTEYTSSSCGLTAGSKSEVTPTYKVLFLLLANIYTLANIVGHE